MKRKFKVLPIGMSVRGNKMANHGDIVDEVNLLTDADILVEQGWIEEVKANTPPATKEVEKEAKKEEKPKK